MSPCRVNEVHICTGVEIVFLRALTGLKAAEGATHHLDEGLFFIGLSKTFLRDGSILKHSPLFLLGTFKNTLPASLVSLFSSRTVTEECFKLLLKHNLSHLAVGGLNIDEFLLTLDLISFLDGHLSFGLDSLHITAVSSFEVRVSNDVVDIDVLLFVSL